MQDDRRRVELHVSVETAPKRSIARKQRRLVVVSGHPFSFSASSLSDSPNPGRQFYQNQARRLRMSMPKGGELDSDAEADERTETDTLYIQAKF